MGSSKLANLTDLEPITKELPPGKLRGIKPAAIERGDHFERLNYWTLNQRTL